MSTNQSLTSTATTTSQGSTASLPSVGNLSVYVPSTAAACLPYLNEVAENYSKVDLQINQQYLQEATIGSEIAHDKAATIRRQAEDNFNAAVSNAVGQMVSGLTSIGSAAASWKQSNPKELENANGYRKAVLDRLSEGPDAEIAEARVAPRAAENPDDVKRRVALRTGGNDGKVYGEEITPRDKDLIRNSTTKEANEMLKSIKEYTSELNDQIRTRIETYSALGNGIGSLAQGVTGAVAAKYSRDGAREDANIALDDASAKTNDEVQSGRNSEFGKIADLEMQIWQAEVQITQANKM